VSDNRVEARLPVMTNDFAAHKAQGIKLVQQCIADARAHGERVIACELSRELRKLQRAANWDAIDGVSERVGVLTDTFYCILSAEQGEHAMVHSPTYCNPRCTEEG
jgi:hypothetical protein